MRVNRMDAY